jgi:hypothetical protein
MTRDQLETWIAQTRRNQQRLAIWLSAAAVIALGLAIAGMPFAKLALAVIAIVAICGFWVTSAHLADWRRRLDHLP